MRNRKIKLKETFFFFPIGNPGSLGARGPIGDVGFSGVYVILTTFFSTLTFNSILVDPA